MTALVNRSGGARGANDGLGRYAVDVEAIAAHELFLDERDLCAKASRAHRADQACCAATNDDEVIARRGGWIFPVCRMDV